MITVHTLLTCRAYLNVCFAYSSRHEMASSMRVLAQGAEEGLILPRSVLQPLYVSPCVCVCVCVCVHMHVSVCACVCACMCVCVCVCV